MDWFARATEYIDGEFWTRSDAWSKLERLPGYHREIVLPTMTDSIARVFAQRLSVALEHDVRPRLFAGIYTLMADLAFEVAREMWAAGSGDRPLAELFLENLTELKRSLAWDGN